MVKLKEIKLLSISMKRFAQYVHMCENGTRLNGYPIKFGKAISFTKIELIRSCLSYGLICEKKDLPDQPIQAVKCSTGPKIVNVELLLETVKAVEVPEVEEVEEEDVLVFKANEAECIKGKKDLVAYCKERGIKIKSASNISLAKMLAKAIELAGEA